MVYRIVCSPARVGAANKWDGLVSIEGKGSLGYCWLQLGTGWDGWGSIVVGERKWEKLAS